MRYRITWWANNHTEEVSAATYEWYLNRGVHQFDAEELDEAEEPQPLQAFLDALGVKGEPSPQDVAKFTYFMQQMKLDEESIYGKR